MESIGLVFSGGGGKGSYEIGVWKYLHEKGLDKHITAVSGTSVGALNAALFVGSSYEKSEELWLNITQKDVLCSRQLTRKEIVRCLISSNVIKVLLPGYVGMIMSSINTAMILNGEYMFSSDGIFNMISDGLDFDKIKLSKIPCFVTCTCYSGLKAERFKLNDYSKDDISNLLMASSAIPVIFPAIDFHGKKYCDGGIPYVGDNVPIQPLYDMKINNIIVVHLGQKDTVDKSKYPNARIIEINPSEDIGKTINGMFDFSAESVPHRLELGYNDTKNILQSIGQSYYSKRNMKIPA